jgi:uncharacterized protein (DUF885 family)
MYSRVPQFSIAVIAGILAFAPGKSRANDADARFQAIYTAEWKWRDEQFPDNEDAQRPIQDHLPKVDPDTQAMRLRTWQDTLRKVGAIPRADLSPAEQLNYDVYRPQIESLIESQQFREYEMPANSDTTFWTDVGYTARRPYRTLPDYRNWIAQMKDIPRYYHEQMDEMRRGLRRGFTPPRVTLTGREASITAVTDATPQSSLFYTPFKDMPGIAEADRAALRTQAISTIRESVLPAYRELLTFMRTEYVPRTRTTLAAYDLPDGKAYYRSKIREFTTLDRDPRSIHAFGESEVARLHGLMLAAMKDSGFSGDFPAFLVFLRTDQRFYAKTPEELLMRAAWIAKRFDGKASRFFGLLPRARFAIEPVPADLAPYYTAGRGGPGLYLVNTYYLPSRPLYNLTALTLHESGHGIEVTVTPFTAYEIDTGSDDSVMQFR